MVLVFLQRGRCNRNLPTLLLCLVVCLIIKLPVLGSSRQKAEIKYRLATCIACISILIGACKKNEVSGGSGLFIKNIATDSATIAIRVIALQQESYLIISRDKIHEHPGYAFKTDKEGNLVFKKRLSSYNRHLQSVIDLPGNGFATVGHDDYFQQHIIVCFYDDDANFISSKQVQLPSTAGNYSNFRILHLSNGNYIFAEFY
jgi:hypothetical protein